MVNSTATLKSLVQASVTGCLRKAFFRSASPQVTLDRSVHDVMCCFYTPCANFSLWNIYSTHNTSILYQAKASWLSSFCYECLQVKSRPISQICVYLSRGARNSHTHMTKLHGTSNYWLLENVKCSRECKMITRVEVEEFVELLAKK